LEFHTPRQKRRPASIRGTHVGSYRQPLRWHSSLVQLFGLLAGPEFRGSTTIAAPDVEAIRLLSRREVFAVLDMRVLGHARCMRDRPPPARGITRIHCTQTRVFRIHCQRILGQSPAAQTGPGRPQEARVIAEAPPGGRQAPGPGGGRSSTAGDCSGAGLTVSRSRRSAPSWACSRRPCFAGAPTTRRTAWRASSIGRGSVGRPSRHRPSS
jgi:hypothetical protein